MSDADLKKYRQLLVDLGRRLSREDERVADEALRPSGVLAEGSAGNVPGDAGDLSVDAASQEESLGLMANERQMLAQVTAALQRIEQGTYGTCTVCGKAIGKERLDALPYTPYCMNDARAMKGQELGASDIA